MEQTKWDALHSHQKVYLDAIRYDMVRITYCPRACSCACAVHTEKSNRTESERVSERAREREKNTYMKSSWRENIDLFSFVNGEHTPHTARLLVFIWNHFFDTNLVIFFDLAMAGSVVLQTWIIMRILFTTLPLIAHWVLFSDMKNFMQIDCKELLIFSLPKAIFSTAFSLWK